MKIAIKSVNSRLQLVFQYQKQRYYLSMGLPDTAVSRRLAELKAAEIEKDILLERFEGLDKYRRTSAEKQPINADGRSKKTEKTDIRQLWSAFVDHQRRSLSPSTMKVYRSHTNSLERMPLAIGLSTPSKLRDWVINNHANSSAKRLFTALNACCKWAVSQGDIAHNPLDGLTIKADTKDEYDIQAFTGEERDHLLATMKDHLYWGYYYRLIGFLFFTGCRPSEAIALTWGDVASSMQALTFHCAAVFGEEGRLAVKNGLKRRSSRTIRINDQVRFFLGDRPSNSQDLFVFPSPNGKIINTRNLAKRTWQPALEVAGIERKKLYQTRHTFITLALAAGISPQDVAKYVGNSTKMIHENYASTSRELNIPRL
jgi:integrase